MTTLLKNSLLLRLSLLIAVVAVAWSLRMRAAEILDNDFDENDYIHAGQLYASLIRAGDWEGFLHTNYRTEHPPLAKFFYALSFLFYPEEPLIEDEPLNTTTPPPEFLPPNLKDAGRTTAAIFGTLEVGLLALINPLAGLLLAIHGFTIKYTSEIMLDGLASLMSMAAAFFYYRSKHSPPESHRRWLIFSAIALGLAADTKYLHSLVGFAILIDWFLTSRKQQKDRVFFKQALAWGLLSIAVFFIANPYLWPDPIGRIQESIASIRFTTESPAVQATNYPIWQPLVWIFMPSAAWQPEAYLFALDPLIAILAFMGLGRLKKQERFFFIWFVVALIVLLVWRTKWPQYILILTAPLSLAAAETLKAAGVEVSEWWRSRHRYHPETVKSSRRDTVRALPWLMLGLTAFLLLTLVPVLFNFALSMTDFNTASLRDGFSGGIWRALNQGLTGQVAAQEIELETRSNQVNFTGLRTYGPVMRYINQGPWSILFFNIMWTVLSVLLQCALGLAVALLLWQRGVKLGKFWQALFILPWAIPELIGAQMWLNIFGGDWGWLALAADKYGPNSFFGVFDQTLQESASLWLIAFLLPATWYGFPFMMLAASAGLKMVPQDVFDASAVDGANAWQTFRSVTLPLLMPLLIPALIVRGIFAFNQFYLFQTYYFQDATLATLSYNIFNPNAGFSNLPGGQFAISAVINIITVIILMAFVLLFNRWSRAAEGVAYA
jgi:arabinogalactan oligomer/maltooligosaccharide transport system permease protein